MPVDARARTNGDPADHAAFACGVSALKDYDNPRPRSLDPALQMSKLNLELRELFIEFVAPHLPRFSRLVTHLLFVSCHLAIPPVGLALG